MNMKQVKAEYFKRPDFEFDYSNLNDIALVPDMSSFTEEDLKRYEEEYSLKLWAFDMNTTTLETRSRVPNYRPFSRHRRALEKLGYVPKELLDMAESRITECVNSFVLWHGCDTSLPDRHKMFEHFHPPNMLTGKPIRTLSFVVPVKHVQPPTEWINFSYQDTLKNYEHPPMPVDPKKFGDHWLSLCLSYKDLEPDTLLKYPTEDQMLMFEFDSTHNVHWTEGIDLNHNLVFIFDDIR